MVSLETLSYASGDGRYVHVKNSTFTITSDYPLSDVSVWPVGTKKLPGRVGTFLLPSDSVISLQSEHTSVEAVKALLESEMDLADRQGLSYSVPVVPAETEILDDAVVVEDDDEDDDLALPFDDDCEEEKEEGQGEGHDEGQEDGTEGQEDEEEWGDDQNLFLPLSSEDAPHKV